MIEYGFPSGLWMSRAVIANAPANLLRKAVDELMKAAWSSDYNCIEIEEVFDRLVQVSTVGSYTPPIYADEVVQNAVNQADELLGEDPERLLKEFEEQLKNLPSMTDEELKRWAEKDEEDDDEQPCAND